MSLVGQRSLDRRRLLRGLGVALGLPLLDAMVPARARAARVRALTPARLAVIYIPNGVIMPRWLPEGDGPDYELSPTLAPLAGLRGEFSVIHGLCQRGGEAQGDGPGDHARAAGSYLTGVHPLKSATQARAGLSFDQRVAQALGGATRLPSLELACARGQTVGACDSGYNCAYQTALAWRSEIQPLPAETDPRAVFDRLFSDGALTPAQRAARRAQQRSLLDHALADLQALERELGGRDREKLDEYLSSVRALERQLEGDGRHPAPRPPAGVRRPASYPATHAEHIQQMGELMRLAFVTDSTRVVTLLCSREGEGKKFPELGGHEIHHEISHHQNDPEKIEVLARIDRFHVEQLARILHALQAHRDGERSLLDRSMVLFGSGLSDGNRHLHTNLPTLIAGRGNGTLRPGRMIRLDRQTPMCNLFVSLLQRMGVPDERFGDSDGALTALDGVA